MSFKPELAILSPDTGQRIACCDSCQLTIAWMHKIKEVTMVIFKVKAYGRTDGQSRDNQNFSDRSKEWGSARTGAPPKTVT